MTTVTPGVGAVGDPSLSGVFRIDREGVWRHEGVEVTHPGVLRNLYANLRADGDTHYLQVGPRRVPVDVDDSPFVVIRAETRPDQEGVGLHLNDGSYEPLDLGTLILDRRGVPYCRVKDGRFRARFSVSAWLQLAGQVQDDPGSDAPVLSLGGRRIALRRLR
jgi:hypothetical protein